MKKTARMNPYTHTQLVKSPVSSYTQKSARMRKRKSRTIKTKQNEINSYAHRGLNSDSRAVKC